MNIEKASEYISATNWKNFVEWLTAEVILNRPSDPLQYARDLIGVKLTERGGSDFRAEKFTDWLRHSYNEATALVDENGIIKGKQLPQSQSTQLEMITELQKREKLSQTLLDYSTRVQCMDSKKVTEIAVSLIASILECEKTMLFFVDKNTGDFVEETREKGALPLIIKPNDGIVGIVGVSGDSINTLDSEDDPAFEHLNQQHEFPVAVLCVPLRKDIYSPILGVIAAVNKNNGLFEGVDESTLLTLASLTANAYDSSSVFEKTLYNRDQWQRAIQAAGRVQQSWSQPNFVFDLSNEIRHLMVCEKCVIHMFDKICNQLVTVTDRGDVDLRTAITDPIVGKVAGQGVTLNITDAYTFEGFNRSKDHASNFQTKAFLCAPMKADDAVVGVVYLANKESVKGDFVQEDNEFLYQLLQVFGPMLSTCPMFNQIQGSME
jgi:signal transduction protein with GAF and PtsI domain